VTTPDTTLLVVLALIALVGPIVTAAATLIAVQLSSRGEHLREQERHQQERARWHLELGTDAYSKLIETADHFRTAARAVYLTPPNDPEYHGYLGEVDRAGQELDDAGSRISLLGSPQVQPVLDQLLAHSLGALHMAAISASAPAEPQQWEKANERFLDLSDQFIKAARKDLGTD
jgi:hypothetical protein